MRSGMAAPTENDAAEVSAACNSLLISLAYLEEDGPPAIDRPARCEDRDDNRIDGAMGKGPWRKMNHWPVVGELFEGPPGIRCPIIVLEIPDSLEANE